METAIENRKVRKEVALFEIGFRPFFLGAAVFAVITIAQWAGVYLFGMKLDTAPVSVLQWHAHEMIYGYCLAVVAGFLLTAAKNWTDLPTSNGLSLVVMFSLWATARVLNLIGSPYMVAAAVVDLLFLLQLSFAVVYPVIQTKQWPRLAILSKLLLLVVFSGVYLLGILGYIANGVHLAIYAGLYLIIGLILTFGRKVIPYFIDRGVGYDVQLFQSRFLDLSSLVLFLIFFGLELTRTFAILSGYIALALFVVNSLRLIGWHTRGIWQKPLLWGLVVSYCFICFGFLLHGWVRIMGGSPNLAIHALAFGGIGLITMSMMARVSLGHTGRKVSEPPFGISIALLLLTTGAIVRVVFPLISSGQYILWIGLSQILWVMGFVIFLWVYTPMLLRPRVDR